MQQIYKTTPMPTWDFHKFALQLFWNHTSAWVFSSKFDAYFQNAFSKEHLWRATSVVRCSWFLLITSISHKSYSEKLEQFASINQKVNLNLQLTRITYKIHKIQKILNFQLVFQLSVFNFQCLIIFHF